MKYIPLACLVLSSVVLVGCGQQGTSDVAVQPKANVVAQDTAVKLASTTYVPYSSAGLDKATSEGKDVAVFFHSKTCGSCAKLHDNIEANMKNIPEGTVIMKADWDENQDLAAEWGVEKYHTVSFVDGQQVNNVKGLFTLNELMDGFDTVEEVSGSNGYVAFNQAGLDKATSEGKDVAVFFHSKTCGSCAKLHDNIEENMKSIPDDTLIMKADWDANQDLAAEWSVDKYHTVSFLNGEKVTNVKGLFTLEELLGNIGG